MASSQRQVPATPRVISPSPTLSETSGRSADGYFGPTTRSGAKKTPARTSTFSIDEDTAEAGENSDHDSRARSRSRSVDTDRRRRMSGLIAANSKAIASASSGRPTRRKPVTSASSTPLSNGSAAANGHLSPMSAELPNGFGAAYWRSLSRSPSPFGLIPIHRSWRSFVHRHEIPRKTLHVSIGFLALNLYTRNYQSADIHPTLLALLVPIAATDIARLHFAPLNRFYIRCLGAFMREAEAHDRYNGVIWYLLGAWTAMRFFPKDVGTVAILLLSWCDTAASTVGRLWGRYTPRIRRGKSLAGSLAAFGVGIGTAVLFWGVVVPRAERTGRIESVGVNALAFQGRLGVSGRALLEGPVAVGVLSVWAGLVAAASEAVDLWNLDDNCSIPVLSGIGLWAFLKVFGSA